ncbi:MAG: universal stress protein [Pseudomonadota bacterium]
MKTILVATDFSERSDRALRRATLLARRSGARIVLAHVVDDDQPRRIVEDERAQAETLLFRMAATLRDVDGVACETRVIAAAPFLGVLQAVEEAAPDLLVIGPHRRQVLRDVFIGTTAERTIRAAGLPVLMVNGPPAADYRHVLRTTDLSGASRAALQRVAALGIGEGARNSILHVFEPPEPRLALDRSLPRREQDRALDDEGRDAARDLARFLASANLAGLEPILRYEGNAPAQEILAAAEEEGADLIVIATHGRGGLARRFLGSVTEQVLRISPIDVLAIPPARAD